MVKLTFLSIIDKLIKTLCLTKEEFAFLMEVDIKTIDNWLNNKNKLNKKDTNKLIEIIQNNDLDIYSLLPSDDESSYLFHGSKTNTLNGPISVDFNKNNSLDFSNGFYLSESLKTAIEYVIYKKDPHIYKYKKNILNSSKIYDFDSNKNGDIEWVLYIGLNRDKINEDTYKNYLVHYFKLKLKNYDVVTGQIADSYNFDVMDAFFENRVSFDNVKKSLLLANIGKQYAIKSQSIADKLELVEEYALDDDLKDYLIKSTKARKDKLKELSIRRKRTFFKGELYFDDVLERINNRG